MAVKPKPRMMIAGNGKLMTEADAIDWHLMNGPQTKPRRSHPGAVSSPVPVSQTPAAREASADMQIRRLRLMRAAL